MKTKRNGFTLIELVVVIMILGILAGVAAPKLLGTSDNATDNGLKQTLAIVRDAIELYAAEVGGLPTCTTDGTGAGNFHDDLRPYIRGLFPSSPVGNKNNLVTGITGATTVADSGVTTGWIFNTDDGTFICNEGSATNSNSSVNYDAL